MFSANAKSSDINLYNYIRLTTTAEASQTLSSSTYSATFELVKDELNKEEKNQKNLSKIIDYLQKEKLQYSQETSSAFSDINGKQSFKAVYKINVITKNYTDIQKIFSIFKKNNFKLSTIEFYADFKLKKEDLQKLYNQAYKKAERKAKLLAKQVEGDFIIKRTYAEKFYDTPESSIQKFDISKNQEIDFVKVKPKKKDIKATVKVYMDIEILPKK